MAIARKHGDAHHDLLPYTRSFLHAASRTGAPVMRPLFFAYPDDASAASLADQYLSVAFTGATTLEIDAAVSLFGPGSDADAGADAAADTGIDASLDGGSDVALPVPARDALTTADAGAPRPLDAAPDAPAVDAALDGAPAALDVGAADLVITGLAPGKSAGCGCALGERSSGGLPPLASLLLPLLRRRRRWPGYNRPARCWPSSTSRPT